MYSFIEKKIGCKKETMDFTQKKVKKYLKKINIHF